MSNDPAIDAIRKTRHELSERFGHDTRALVAHYKSLEPKYADRLVRDSSVQYSLGDAADRSRKPDPSPARPALGTAAPLQGGLR